MTKTNNQAALEVEYRLQQICPGCGRQMTLSRVISWPDGKQSAVYECASCWIAVSEPSPPIQPD
jgi:predicted RNA-binding Zn-ribbon protein involved in translation (DUF1610 family)